MASHIFSLFLIFDLEMSATESMEINKYGESDKHVVALFPC